MHNFRKLAALLLWPLHCLKSDESVGGKARFESLWIHPWLAGEYLASFPILLLVCLPRFSYGDHFGQIVSSMAIKLTDVADCCECP